MIYQGPVRFMAVNAHQQSVLQIATRPDLQTWKDPTPVCWMIATPSDRHGNGMYVFVPFLPPDDPRSTSAHFERAFETLQDMQDHPTLYRETA